MSPQGPQLSFFMRFCDLPALHVVIKKTGESFLNLLFSCINHLLMLQVKVRLDWYLTVGDAI